MKKTDKTLEAFSVSDIKEIINGDQSDLKQAVNYFIKNCKNKIVALRNKNFKNYDQLAALNFKLTNYLIKIEEDEKICSEKDSDNPRELRDTLKNNEDRKAAATINIQINKKEVENTKIRINELSDRIDKIEKDIKKLHLKINSAKEYYKNHQNDSSIE